jgi:hypothetical protein
MFDMEKVNVLWQNLPTIGPIVVNNIFGYLYLLISLLSSDAKLGVGRSVSKLQMHPDTPF